MVLNARFQVLVLDSIDPWCIMLCGPVVQKHVRNTVALTRQGHQQHVCLPASMRMHCFDGMSRIIWILEAIVAKLSSVA